MTGPPAPGAPPAGPDREPMFRVVAGQPTAAELAALTAALSVKLASRPRHAQPRARPSAWADRRALLRIPPTPGPGAWRRSARPR